VNINLPYGRVEDAVPKLTALCDQQGLVVFDYQTEELNEGSGDQ
jgi:hypothetical protein